MKVAYKLLTWLVLPAIIVALVYAIVSGIMEPINFEKARVSREKVAIQRLQDLRELEVAFKSEVGRYTESIDTLKLFYNKGKLSVDVQIGSADDSASVAFTAALKKEWLKKDRKMTNEVFSAKCYEYYQDCIRRGDNETANKLVFTVKTPKLVRETLFQSKEKRVTEFNIDSVFVIPFCNEPVQISSTIKEVSGVPVPLFQACMPYKKLLKGLDRQLIINLNKDREKMEKYEGLKVGDVEKANNNAGNWE